ncbi:MBL fold metallo-hydrolase [Rodentibacter caecimuris]|uniref:MBL fold metallo-hydrolase n=2 Tax=Rodentibacter caecimuris TaxID=1796644 RepID=A0ABX3L1A2_9PAST|nr:MBL fold metallo-hydrolase [Rodentibacter heylii]
MHKIFIPLFVLTCLIALICYVFMQTKAFGQLPRAERLIRVKQSPNYKNDQFVNLSPTKIRTGNKSEWQIFYDFLFEKIDNIRPNHPLPSIKTNLNKISSDRNFFVWFGHSSYLLQIDGATFLVDPVLVGGSPLPFINKMFDGSNIYSPEEMPEIDYLIITHDHWDHLDYKAVTRLQPKVKKVITALGVGAHLEYWGYPTNKIIELDWEQQQEFDDVIITALPARHFSGRTLTRNQTLWASFMLETSNETVYIGGDSGYDPVYQSIGKQFPNISLAMMENGQYDNNWANIHIQPHELVRAIKELNPKKVISVHNAKFALARHSWKAPLEQLSQAAERENIPLFTPMIGEVFYFSENNQQFGKWWDKVD